MATPCNTVPNWAFICNIFSNDLPRTVGISNKRNVCPVGAVSKITTSKFVSFTRLAMYLKFRDSSTPGNEFLRSLMTFFAFSSGARPNSSFSLATFGSSFVGSSSRPYKLLYPFIKVGSLPIF